MSQSDEFRQSEEALLWVAQSKNEEETLKRCAQALFLLFAQRASFGP